MRDILKAARDEITFPGRLKQGARGSSVRRVQEWLSLQGFATTIDGGFGPATQKQLEALAAKNDVDAGGGLNETLWALLVEPMAAVLEPVNVGARATVSSLTLKVAKIHAAAAPREVGGENCGPWVRAYMDGNDGADWPWCAGFATFVIGQACQLLDEPMPVLRTFSCDSLANDAAARDRLLTPSQVDWIALGTAQVFLVQRTPTDWTHCGIAFAGEDDTFSTVEGNTNDTGGREGYEVCIRTRSLPGKSIVSLD